MSQPPQLWKSSVSVQQATAAAKGTPAGGIRTLADEAHAAASGAGITAPLQDLARFSPFAAQHRDTQGPATQEPG